MAKDSGHAMSVTQRPAIRLPLVRGQENMRPIFSRWVRRLGFQVLSGNLAPSNPSPD